jgi:hypothetical protein
MDKDTDQIVTVVTDATDNSTSFETFSLKDLPRDIVGEIAAIKLEMQEWANFRSLEYPSVGEQLAALYESRQGNDEPIKAIDAKIKSVKDKFPKPDFDKLEAKLKEIEADTPEPTTPPIQIGVGQKQAEEQ